MVHQAAVEGQGVALGAEALFDDEISQGLLVPPFDHSVEVDGVYYLVHPPGARIRPNVKAFCEWLSVEAQTTIVRKGVFQEYPPNSCRPRFD